MSPGSIVFDRMFHGTEETQEKIDSQYGSDSGAGFVVVLHEPATFTVQVLLPQEVVRGLKQITARIVDAGKAAAVPKGSPAECSLAP